LKFVGIFGPNKEEWTMLDMVSAKYGNTLVPLYDSHGPKNVEFCLKHTNLTTAFVVTAKVKTMI
jgi:long-subunit acyl-CoA synthetase (AMP-forming)